MASAGGRDCCVMQWRLHLARTSDEDLDDFGLDQVYGRALDRSLFQLTGRDRERRFRVHKEAPGFRPGPRNRSLFLLNINRLVPDPTSHATVLQVSWTGNECEALVSGGGGFSGVDLGGGGGIQNDEDIEDIDDDNTYEVAPLRAAGSGGAVLNKNSAMWRMREEVAARRRR